jgi:phage terminase small subunit
MKTNELTIKQEAFCQAYIRLGDKSAAYRESYSTKNMKVATVNERASRLSNEYKISTRIAFLQKEIKEENKATISEVLNTLSDMLRFDIAELYDENGNLKKIHSIPKKSRLMISQLEIDEIIVKNESIGQVKKIKVFDKMQAVEKFMKHFGAYEKDNGQKQPIVNVDLSGEFTPEKKARLLELKKKLDQSLENS